MIKYFNNITTLDEAKKAFYELAKIHHPDKGGDTATFQEILNQFHSFKAGEEKFKGEFQQWDSTAYSSIIMQLIKIPEINIEVCGSWIWISGNTKPYKENIKAINTEEKYRRGWSKAKSLWYFSPVGYRKKSRTELSLDEIREMYGSQNVNNKTENNLASVE